MNDIIVIFRLEVKNKNTKRFVVWKNGGGENGSEGLSLIQRDIPIHRFRLLARSITKTTHDHAIVITHSHTHNYTKQATMKAAFIRPFLRARLSIMRPNKSAENFPRKLNYELRHSKKKVGVAAPGECRK